MNNKLTNILWGLVLVALGLIFGLNALEITDINIFFDGWWTLFIIVPSAIGLFKSSDKTSNIIGILLGIFLLLACQDILDFEMILKLVVPAILVIIGISFIFRDTIGDKVRTKMKDLPKNGKDYCATFAEQNVDYSGDIFDGCSLTAIFGTVNCNLKDTIINEDCAVYTSALFGNVSIHVPDNVNVKITSTPIFGGVSDKRRNKPIDAPFTLYINASCMFGGVDIK